MLNSLSACVFLSLVGSLFYAGANDTIRSLEQELKETENSLSLKAHYNYQTSEGAVGYRSNPHDSSDNTEWVKIDFKTPQSFDQIVLVPCLTNVSEGNIQGDAFPVEFHLIAGVNSDPIGKKILEVTENAQLSPRKSPASFDLEVKEVDWVKLIVTKLGSRAWDGAHLLQLSEILIFNKEENIALHQKISTSSGGKENNYGARRERFLVDGSLPYVMDAAEGGQSAAYVAIYDQNQTPRYLWDLGKPVAVDRLVIHALELGDSIPQANAPDFGLPDEFMLYGANNADFSDEKLLCKFNKTSFYDCARIISLPFQPSTLRHFKFEVTKDDTSYALQTGEPLYLLGLAELELHSKGRNVLKGEKLIPHYERHRQKIPVSRLTDGKNLYGEVLPLRQWMNQLSDRHDLTIRRASLEKKLQEKYDQREKTLLVLSWLVAALIVALLVLYLINRILQMRRVSALRKSFAADLHDELGANLHAIGLLSDVAKDSASQQDVNQALLNTIDKIRSTTQRSTDAVRHCIHSSEGRKPLGNFLDEMKRVARRMFEDEDYTISVDIEKALGNLPLKKRHGLFLFYKECLVNISKHSDATEFSVKLYKKAPGIIMEVIDNGIGCDHETPPSSLVRRAKLLKAHLKVQPSPHDTSGTHITLSLPVKNSQLL